MRVACFSWLVGTLTATAVHREPLPTYFVDLPPTRETTQEPVWLRPGTSPLVSPPSFCAFSETGQTLIPLMIPYTASAAGSLRLGAPELLRPSAPVVLVLAPQMPSCRGLAWLGSVGGSSGLMFRSFVKLAGAQVLRLQPQALP